MLYVLAAGGNIVLENPSNSLVALHGRYIQLLRMLLQVGVIVAGLGKNLFGLEVKSVCFCLAWWFQSVFACVVGTAETYKVAMWMRKFRSFTWKRTWLWSTSPEIYKLDLGPMTSSERKTTCTTTVRSVNGDGKACWTANANLKPTQ